MIINTGMRTDIPAFYTPWFLNRLRERFVLVRNSYRPEQVTRYRLSPDVVDLIGFCTKDPEPLLPHLDALEPYGQYWFVTITPYGRDIEPGVPPVERVLKSFRQLSDQVGADRVGWRYDPIFLSDKYTLDFHRRAFAKMAEALAGYTHACVISFIDLYPKVTRNFPEVLPVGREDRLALGQYIIQTARANGMVLRPCGEGSELAPYGADCGGCMTLGILEKALGEGIRAPKQRGARKACSCHITCDIGAYDTCAHLCRYCYANTSREAVLQNRQRHDPRSPLLIGHLQPGDQLRQAHQESWRDRQGRLF